MSKAPNKTADERYTTNLYGVKFILAGTLSEEENSSDSFPPFLLKGLLRLIFNPSFCFFASGISSHGQKRRVIRAHPTFNSPVFTKKPLKTLRIAL